MHAVGGSHHLALSTQASIGGYPLRANAPLMGIAMIVMCENCAVTRLHLHVLSATSLARNCQLQRNIMRVHLRCTGVYRALSLQR